MEPTTSNTAAILPWQALSAEELQARDDDESAELQNKDSQQDAFQQPDETVSQKVTNQAVTKEGEAAKTKNLDIDFKGTEDPQEAQEAKGAYDIADRTSRDEYQDKLMQDFQQQLKNIKPGDIAAFKKLLEDTGAQIQGDMQNGVLNDNGQNFSEADFLNAVKMMEEAQRKTLDRLASKAANAGNVNSNADQRAAEDKEFFDALKRQARIDKWETLKDQQYVYYLKATLAGIKASEKLAASAR